jgi:thymidylate synthase
MSEHQEYQEYQEYQYLNLLRRVLDNGTSRPDRTGTGTLSVFGERMVFDIRSEIPILTTKFVPWKSCIKELLWFLKGQTDVSILQQQGVHIWDGNSSREFLDNRGLHDLPEWDISCGYGFQWRHFGAKYKTCKDDYHGEGFDQVQYILNELRTNPFSRRLYMTSWNAADIDKMALPPCHLSAQFYVDIDEQGEKHLSCQMYQRSVDTFLGCPWNIMSYAVLTHLFAKMTDMKPKTLIMCLGDTHIYSNHIEQVCQQLERTPYPFPKMLINDAVKMKSIDEITIDDFSVQEYKYHPSIKAPMAV